MYQSFHSFPFPKHYIPSRDGSRPISGTMGERWMGCQSTKVPKTLSCLTTSMFLVDQYPDKTHTRMCRTSIAAQTVVRAQDTTKAERQQCYPLFHHATLHKE